MGQATLISYFTLFFYMALNLYHSISQRPSFSKLRCHYKQCNTIQSWNWVILNWLFTFPDKYWVFLCVNIPRKLKLYHRFPLSFLWYLRHLHNPLLGTMDLNHYYSENVVCRAAAVISVRSLLNMQNLLPYSWFEYQTIFNNILRWSCAK